MLWLDRVAPKDRFLVTNDEAAQMFALNSGIKSVSPKLSYSFASLGTTYSNKGKAKTSSSPI
jgi:hypothetical protein